MSSQILDIQKLFVLIDQQGNKHMCLVTEAEINTTNFTLYGSLYRDGKPTNTNEPRNLQDLNQ